MPWFLFFKFKVLCGWGEDFLCSQHVLLKFPMGSQYVPKVLNVFLNIYPLNSTSHYLRSFALSSTFITYITSPKVGYHNINILGLCKAWFFIFIFQWANHRCPSYILWGSRKWINANHRVYNQKWWPSFEHIITQDFLGCNTRPSQTLNMWNKLNVTLYSKIFNLKI
jgi:hypothetical protein